MARQLSDAQLLDKYVHLQDYAMELAVGACIVVDGVLGMACERCPFCLGKGCTGSQLHARRLPLMRELQKVVGNKVADITDRGCTKSSHVYLSASNCIRILRVDNDPANPDHKRPCAACAYHDKFKGTIIRGRLAVSAGHAEMHAHLSNIEKDVERRFEHRQRIEAHENKDETAEVMARLRTQVEDLQTSNVKYAGRLQKANEKVKRRDVKVAELENQITVLKEQKRGLESQDRQGNSHQVGQLRLEIGRLERHLKSEQKRHEEIEKELRKSCNVSFREGKKAAGTARSSAERALSTSNKTLRNEIQQANEARELLAKQALSLACEVRDLRRVLKDQIEGHSISVAGYEANDDLLALFLR